MKRIKKHKLEQVVIKVMKKYGHMNSLKELREKVLEEIRKNYPEASVSLARLKEIVKELENIALKVHVRRSIDKEIEICPVCGMPLKKVYEKTLSGNKVFCGLKCENCSLFSKTKSFRPARYEIYFLK